MTIKVLHLTYDMRIGGTEMVIKNLILGSVNDAISHEIFCIEENIGPFGKMLQEQGVKITGAQREEGFDLQLIKKLRSYLLTNNIDVIHCHQYSPWVYGVFAAALTNTKVIFTEHGRFYPDSSSWKRKLVNPFLTLFTNRITAISRATKEALVEFEFIKQNKIQVVYNGIAEIIANQTKVEELRKHYQIPASAKVLGTIARLDPIKNQTMMIRAFAKVAADDENVYLIIVGGGEEELKLKTLVQDLNIGDKVIFTGYIDKPVDHLAMMDIFLLSSLSEGTSMTLLESLCLGKPCVVTDAGGNSEIIQNEINGRVVENNNAEQFSSAIIELLKNESNLEVISKVNKSRFWELFSCEIMCQEFDEIYKSLTVENKNG